MGEKQGSHSVTAKRRLVTVAPSPFNGVKFELGVLLIALIPIWLLVDRLVQGVGTQSLILLGYSGVASLWLVGRARHILARQLKRGSEQHGP